MPEKPYKANSRDQKRDIIVCFCHVVVRLRLYLQGV